MRCTCCNNIFHPEIHYDEDGKFSHFEEICSECTQAAFSDESYEDVFEHLWVKPLPTIMYKE